MRLIDADALLEEMVGITDGWLKPPKDWKWYEDSVRNAPAVGSWVSVKDRLPELDKDVLVYAVGKEEEGFGGKHATAICNRYVLRLFPASFGNEVWSEPWQYFHTDYEITHWMPLPEPPKEVSE